MRRLLTNARASVSRSNILTITLSVILGAVSVFGFATQITKDRDTAIEQAVQLERDQRTQFWQDVRGDLSEMKTELKEYRGELRDLRLEIMELKMQVARRP